MVNTEDKQKIVDQNKKVLVGEVVSDKMAKTIVVRVSNCLRHPRYGKVVTYHKKYKAHDEQEVAQIGDKVEIQECRPYSKTKYMVLRNVVKK